MSQEEQVISLAVVVPYDYGWPGMFGQIAEQVDRALSTLRHEVVHVGSTSVPGLAAKPIIDLFAVVESRQDVPVAVAALEAAGWPHEGDGGRAGRECFGSRGGLPYHHLYVVVRDSEQHRLPVRFRDILRSDADAREEYAALKHELAPVLATDRSAYTEQKSTLIESILVRHSA